MWASHSSGEKKSKKKMFTNGRECGIGGTRKKYIANGKVAHSEEEGKQTWRHKKELYVDRSFKNRQKL